MVWQRIKILGWSEDRAFSEPKGKGRGIPDPNSIAGKARAHGINRETVRERIKAGYSEHDALTLPVGIPNNRPDPKSLASKAKAHNIQVSTVYYRINRLGWSERKALTTPLIMDPKSGTSFRARAIKNGVEYGTARSRFLKLGFDIETALSRPAFMLPGRVGGHIIRKLARERGLPIATVYSRLKQGESVEQALTPGNRLHDPEWRARVQKIATQASVEAAKRRLVAECRERHMPYPLVKQRIRRGWSRKRALTTPSLTYGQ